MSRVQSSVAVEVERLQDAGAGHHPHALAVGDRRRRRHVLLPLLMVAAAERPLPQHGARWSDRCTRGTGCRPRGAADRRRRSERCDRPRRSASSRTRPGSASFQVMFSVFDQRTGRFFSALRPLSDGPRHCGQFSADDDAKRRETEQQHGDKNARRANARNRSCYRSRSLFAVPLRSSALAAIKRSLLRSQRLEQRRAAAPLA